MDRKPDYFGMTGMQVGLLAVLALMLCVLTGVGLIVVFASLGPAPAAVSSVQQPPAPEPTYTFWPTLAPTPSPTAAPTSTPIPGWKSFQGGGGVELWLPESYEGGDPSQDAEGIVLKIKALGSDFDEIAKEVEQKLPERPYALFAFDSNVGEALTLTTVQIESEPLDPDAVITLDDYLDALVKNLQADQRLVDRRIQTLDAHEAGRLFIDYKITDEEISVYRERAVYAIRVGGAMWVIQFFTERSDFERQLPIFELSVRTFAVHSE